MGDIYPDYQINKAHLSQNPDHVFYFFEVNEALREHLGLGINAVGYLQLIKDLKQTVKVI